MPIVGVAVDHGFFDRCQLRRAVPARALALERLAELRVVDVDAERMINRVGRINPNEEPITLPLDFGPDIEWRRNAPGEEKKAG